MPGRSRGGGELAATPRDVVGRVAPREHELREVRDRPHEGLLRRQRSVDGEAPVPGAREGHRARRAPARSPGAPPASVRGTPRRRSHRQDRRLRRRVDAVVPREAVELVGGPRVEPDALGRALQLDLVGTDDLRAAAGAVDNLEVVRVAVWLQQVLHALLHDREELHAHREAVLGRGERVGRQLVVGRLEELLGEAVPRREALALGLGGLETMDQLRLPRAALPKHEEQTVDAAHRRLHERHETLLRDGGWQDVAVVGVVEDELGLRGGVGRRAARRPLLLAAVRIESEHHHLLVLDVDVICLRTSAGRRRDELAGLVDGDARELGLDADGLHP